MNPLAQYMENNSRLLYSIGSNEYGLQYVVTAISVCICCSSHSLSTAHWLQFLFSVCMNRTYRQPQATNRHTAQISQNINVFFFSGFIVSLWPGHMKHLLAVRVLTTNYKMKNYLIIAFAYNNSKCYNRQMTQGNMNEIFVFFFFFFEAS